jgi:glucose-1-phosphate cytidylyltransferase
MKAVILAGGSGIRVSDEHSLKPKPMIEIGGKPILWHIMKHYSGHGVSEFIICCGYKGYMIKEYFANYFLHMADVTFDIQRNSMQVHHRHAEPWKVTLIDTGEYTLTGGRLKRATKYLESEAEFCFTYGDGLTDLDISAEIAFHRKHRRWATVTVVQSPGRYGALRMQGDAVEAFVEKPPGDSGVINGGFFVLSPKCLDLIAGDETAWENAPLAALAEMKQIMGWRHGGFWQPVDTPRDRNRLEELWASGKPPWKNW